MRIKTDLDGKIVGAIERHYFHAREKHPYFCDKIAYMSKTGADNYLNLNRKILALGARVGDVEAVNVLNCELYEAVQAYTNGDNAAAVEECYDAIAVLLRVVDVLEGRQKLGKPEEGGEK